MAIPRIEILGLLACPVCHGELVQTEDATEASGIRCSACSRVYPIQDGIPILIGDRAVKRANRR
jgi:uncharacterized protein YbaR (Trm112 family)